MKELVPLRLFHSPREKPENTVQQGLANCFVKGHMVNILDAADHMVPVASSQYSLFLDSVFTNLLTH